MITSLSPVIVGPWESNLQSPKMSAVETVTSVAIGYAVALATQLAVFPLFAIEINHAQHVAMGAIFTVVSIVRSYLVRRMFVAIERRG